MESIATTKLSSKGQVVIPEMIRDQLGLKEGVQFVVLGQKDVVILKVVTPLSGEDFKGLISQARRQARSARLKKKDVLQAIKKVRRS